ncbi:MAG: hypothetical protein WA992_13620, partial [Desulfobulbales bacterium]
VGYVIEEETCIIIKRNTFPAGVSGSQKFFQQHQILLTAGEGFNFNGNILVFPQNPFLIPARYKFFGGNTERDARLAPGTLHIIDDITVTAITGCEVCIHDKIRNGVKEGLVVNSLKWKTIGAFYRRMDKMLLQFISNAFRFPGKGIRVFCHAAAVSVILEDRLFL